MTKNFATLFITLFIGFINCQWTKDERAYFQEELLLEVNYLRITGCKCGEIWMPAVKPLKWNAVLESASARHVKDMVKQKRLNHTGSDGSDVATRVTDAGYNWSAVGENIAKGYASEKAVIAAWKKSPGHCKNIMKAAYTEMGVARSGNYWAQTFAKPRIKG